MSDQHSSHDHAMDIPIHARFLNVNAYLSGWDYIHAVDANKPQTLLDQFRCEAFHHSSRPDISTLCSDSLSTEDKRTINRCEDREKRLDNSPWNALESSASKYRVVFKVFPLAAKEAPAPFLVILDGIFTEFFFQCHWNRRVIASRSKTDLGKTYNSLYSFHFSKVWPHFPERIGKPISLFAHWGYHWRPNIQDAILSFPRRSLIFQKIRFDVHDRLAAALNLVSLPVRSNDAPRIVLSDDQGVFGHETFSLAEPHVLDSSHVLSIRTRVLSLIAKYCGETFLSC